MFCGLDLRKKARKIMILDTRVTGSVLKQESGQSGCDHAVLIPLRMVADELPHPFKQSLRHLGLQADAGAAGSRGRSQSAGQGRPSHAPLRRALVSLRFRLLQGGTAAIQPSTPQGKPFRQSGLLREARDVLLAKTACGNWVEPRSRSWVCPLWLPGQGLSRAQAAAERFPQGEGVRLEVRTLDGENGGLFCGKPGENGEKPNP